MLARCLAQLRSLAGLYPEVAADAAGDAEVN